MCVFFMGHAYTTKSKIGFSGKYVCIFHGTRVLPLQNEVNKTMIAIHSIDTDHLIVRTRFFFHIFACS
jgi:hypothetical protein